MMLYNPDVFLDALLSRLIDENDTAELDQLVTNRLILKLENSGSLFLKLRLQSSF